VEPCFPEHSGLSLSCQVLEWETIPLQQCWRRGLTGGVYIKVHLPLVLSALPARGSPVIQRGACPTGESSMLQDGINTLQKCMELSSFPTFHQLQQTIATLTGLFAKCISGTSRIGFGIGLINLEVVQRGKSPPSDSRI
jgi:hypothetical protein